MKIISSKLISDDDLLLLAEKVVVRYVIAGTIPGKEKEDVKMAIVEKFLNKQQKLLSNFSGKAKISTYCIAVLNKMCCEVIRKELKSWKVNDDEEGYHMPKTQQDSTSAGLMIKDEVEYLERILIMFDEEFNKIKLFLAFFFQLNIHEADILDYDPKYKAHKISAYFLQNEIKNKGEIFENLAMVVNIVEDKKLKSDAVRMWLNKIIERIIARLNGSFGRANYNKESFQILFEYYYAAQAENR